jgi:hypothetical protein
MTRVGGDSPAITAHLPESLHPTFQVDIRRRGFTKDPDVRQHTRSCVTLNHFPPEVSISVGVSLSEELPAPTATPCVVG